MTQAQSKQLTLDDLIPGGKNYYRFVPKNLRNLQWCGNYYIYLSGDTLHLNTTTNHTRHITIEQLNKALSEANLPTYQKWPSFSVMENEKNALLLRVKNNYVKFDINTLKANKCAQKSTQGERYEYDPQSHHIAYTKGQNVWITTPQGDSIQITNETEPGIVCGIEVHQREFGISKGLFWSPMGNALAFYRMDESMVPEYPIVTVTTRMAETRPVRYPMAGTKSHHVTIGVYNVNNQQTTYLKTGLPKEKFLTNIAWNPEGTKIYIEEVNRHQDTCQLVRYDALTGKREAVLITETDSRYVEPQTPITFVPTNSNLFVRQSCSDGFNHLYLYNTDGKLIRQLTKGPWMVTNVLGFADNKESIVFQATTSKADALSTDGLERHIWKVDINTGKLTKLTTDYGVHTAQLSSNGRYIIDNYSGPSTPRSINIYDTKTGALIKHLLTASDTYKGYTLPNVRIGKLLANDGHTELNYRIVTPPDMDSTKKYPTVIYVYGGPHAQMITSNWMYGMRGWDIYMALRGYIVFTLDNRGSAARGHEFESVIHRNLGKNEMDDQMTGVHYLQSLPFVDSERIGVHGWSFGGFMTTNLMLTYPDVFKVGVAGGPVIDWERYEIMYGERYMDTPDENPEGYKNANLTLRAGNLKGRLLMIHGTVDPVVVWQHSLLMLKACIEAGTQPDYFVYPEHEHNVIGPDRPHLHEKITRYFDDYLK
ncbi:MAG: DPP IV N-terminal domain-containing protein [Bacteroidales bacterium]|nr:DPP IV N-terminal domain-containing protein [Bacteroidales bacterium]